MTRQTAAARAPTAPPWHIQQWFNTDTPPSLERLRGKVIVLEAFQMLCPGCVSHSLPQAARVHELFSADDVAVIGLHAVFEHHQAMTPLALEAFLHEYRIGFPVAVDQPSEHGPIPLTMQAYGMRGTPSLVLIDAQGVIRQHRFGRVDDIALGAQIATLVAEAATHKAVEWKVAAAAPSAAGCDDDRCGIRPAAAS